MNILKKLMGIRSSDNMKSRNENIAKLNKNFSMQSDGQWAKIIEQLNQNIDSVEDRIRSTKLHLSMFSHIILYNCKTNNKNRGVPLLYEQLILERYLNSSEGHLDDLIDHQVTFKMVFSKWMKNPSDQTLLSFLTNKATITSSFLDLLCKELKTEECSMKRGLS